MNEPILHHLADPELLEQAKQIFGEDLVTGAWLQAEEHPNSAFNPFTLEQIEYSLQQRLLKPKEKITCLEYGCSDSIVIEFSNGRFVNFSSSEWGWASIASPPREEN